MEVTKSIPKSRAKTAYGLLSEIRALILAEPKRYDQTTFIARENDAWSFVLGLKMPACGTVGCVAGWVATLKGPRDFSYEDASMIAEDILGVPCHDLFNGGAVKQRPQTAAHAKAGAHHIAKFQKEHRAQLLAKKV